MNFEERFDARQRELNEKKYSERHLTNAFVGGVIAGGLGVLLAQAPLNTSENNQEEKQTQQTTVKGKD